MEGVLLKKINKYMRRIHITKNVRANFIFARADIESAPTKNA